MCNVKLEVNESRNINFAVYNLILSKKQEEFTVEEIARDLQHYANWSYSDAESKVKKLLNIWMKSGRIEDHINKFARV